MHWVTIIVSIVVGAVLVLALIAVFDILFRAPHGKRSRKDQATEARDYSRESTMDGSKGTQVQQLKRPDGANN